MRPLVRNDLEFEVMGLHLTVRRIVGIAVLACLLVLAGLMVSELFADDTGPPPVNNTTGRYEEDKTISFPTTKKRNRALPRRRRSLPFLTIYYTEVFKMA